jgi:uncharacterized protein with HEPN domain
MTDARSLIPRLTDIIEAIERVNGVMGDMPLDDFAADWQSQWLVERGVEIISEASRHLTDSLKTRHPEIPWQKVAGIGNVLRHDYGNIAAPVMWALVRESLPQLDKICRDELAAGNPPKPESQENFDYGQPSG